MDKYSREQEKSFEVNKIIIIIQREPISLAESELRFASQSIVFLSV